MSRNEEPWKLNDKQRRVAEEMGLDEAGIEALEARREKEYKTARAKSLEEMGMTEEEMDSFFHERYGIDHECHCLEDRYTGQMLVGTLCEIEIKEKALDKVEELLMDLVIQDEKLDALRRQLIELGKEPVA